MDENKGNGFTLNVTDGTDVENFNLFSWVVVKYNIFDPQSWLCDHFMRKQNLYLLLAKPTVLPATKILCELHLCKL